MGEGFAIPPFIERKVIMAEVKKNTEERVPLLIPRLRDPKADQDVFLSVNFEDIIVRRGVEVMVKPQFKKAWEESVRAEDEALDFEKSESAKLGQ